MNMQRGGTNYCNFPEPEVTTSQAPTRPPPSCTPPRRPPPPSSARPAPRRTHHTPCKRIFTCRCNKKIHCRNFFKCGHIRCIELCLVGIAYHLLAFLDGVLKDEATTSPTTTTANASNIFLFQEKQAKKHSQTKAFVV